MAQHKHAQQVRIIGGKWRGRKLHFSGGASLRPTLSRTRETLFNWLRPHIYQARCLDAFAGSGVLGFEALSQGAAEVVFVEQNPRTVRGLNAAAEALHAVQACTVVKGDALGYLKRTAVPFDVVFLDPPYRQPELLSKALAAAAANQLVNQFVYVEAQQASSLDALAARCGFSVSKQTRAGDTVAALLEPHLDIAGSPAQG